MKKILKIFGTIVLLLALLCGGFLLLLHFTKYIKLDTSTEYTVGWKYDDSYNIVDEPENVLFGTLEVPYEFTKGNYTIKMFEAPGEYAEAVVLNQNGLLGRSMVMTSVATMEGDADDENYEMAVNEAESFASIYDVLYPNPEPEMIGDDKLRYTYYTDYSCLHQGLSTFYQGSVCDLYNLGDTFLCVIAYRNDIEEATGLDKTVFYDYLMGDDYAFISDVGYKLSTLTDEELEEANDAYLASYTYVDDTKAFLDEFEKGLFTHQWLIKNICGTYTVDKSVVDLLKESLDEQ